MKRSSSKEDLKIIKLFDAWDKMNEYDEKQVLKNYPAPKNINFQI